jgi:hypothetical protein
MGGSSSIVGSSSIDTGRFLYESAKWSYTTPLFGVEASGTGSTLLLQNGSTNDNSTTATDLTYSTLVPAAILTSYRNGPLVLSNNSRYFMKQTVASGTGVYQGAYMVMRTSAPTNSNAPTLIYPSDGHLSFTTGVGATINPTTLNDNGYTVESCTVSPALPAGLTLNNSTCVVDGIPTATSSSKLYQITVTNSQGSSTTFVEMKVQ